MMYVIYSCTMDQAIRLRPAVTSLWPVPMSALREYRPCDSASAGRDGVIHGNAVASV